MPSKPKVSASGVFPTLAKTADFRWIAMPLGPTLAESAYVYVLSQVNVL